MDQAILAARLAACRLRGVRPPAGLRRSLRQMHRNFVFMPPMAPACCLAGQCLGELSLILGDVVPVLPGHISCRAEGEILAPASPGALGRFLLLLIGALMPPYPNWRLSLFAYPANGRVCVQVFFYNCAQKMPPRSLCRSANRWAAERGGMVLFSGRGALLVLPKGRGQPLPPGYSLWARDRYSPVYALLPLRLILPD